MSEAQPPEHKKRINHENTEDGVQERRHNDLQKQIEAVKKLAHKLDLDLDQLPTDDFFWLLVLGSIEDKREKAAQILEKYKIVVSAGDLEKVEDALQEIAISFAIDDIRESDLDSLTGAWSRRTLEDRIRYLQSLENFKPQQIFLLHFIDLDDFSEINNTYGHLVGDELLKKVVQALRDFTRAQDSVYRYGGDEFCLLQVINQENYLKAAKKEDLTLEEFIIKKAEELRQKVMTKTKVLTNNQEASVTLSTGITLISPDQHPLDILEAGDTQMYRAKNKEKNQLSSDI